MDPAPGRAGRGGEHVDERRHVVVGDALALVDRLDRERRGADRLELARGGAAVAEQVGSSSQAATSTRRQVSMRASSVQSAPSGAGVAGDHPLTLA